MGSILKNFNSIYGKFQFVKPIYWSGRINYHANKLLEWKKINHSSTKRLIEAYENYGHLNGSVNPLELPESLHIQQLQPETYGLALNDKISTQEDGTITELVDCLHSIYCGNLTIETMNINNNNEKNWLLENFNQILNTPCDAKSQEKIWKLLINSQMFDNFLAIKFATLKRYGCEGAESMLVFVDQCLQLLSTFGVNNVVMGMPHRGRNNLLQDILKFPLEVMFRKIKGLSEFPQQNVVTHATGDVLSHLSTSTNVIFDEISNQSIHVSLLPNSSFLESVNPVAMGKCRGRQETLKESLKRSDKAVCLLLHGDGSFAGQGVVMECFNMTDLPNFSVGGTIHLIVNNQLGFTTPSHLGRSTCYASDIGKMIGCPILHVNGDDPELVLKAAILAVKYQRKYRRDIIVDMICYRRWGHNEMDEPSYTQPDMYQRIKNQIPIADVYANKLISDNILTEESVNEWKNKQQAIFNNALKNSDDFSPSATYLNSSWKNMQLSSCKDVSIWDTGCSADELLYVGSQSVKTPKEFEIHKHIQKSHVDDRIKKLTTGSSIDWALAETFAIGSLLTQGFGVRLSGQDVCRGTFSHRHLGITCQKTNNLYYPLNHLSTNQTAFLEIAPSLLSEEAVLGFEYGISIENPNRLVIWEAQFGDFFTGAQVPVDTLVMSGESKWMNQSGLVLLLPHGYDGAGPEHSSSRIERFLQSSNSKEDGVDGDNVNISVCHPTSPAQYFHLLRRQMIRNFRKPLIIASPKILLRLQAATSPLRDFLQGTHFFPVLGDPYVDNLKSVHKIIFCSGKHFYALHEERLKQDNAGTGIAIIRLEELCPFPAFQLQQILAKVEPGCKFVWAQEEPRNMGPWTFVEPRFRYILNKQLIYAGRPTLAAPAEGIGSLHRQLAKQAIEDAFK